MLYLAKISESVKNQSVNIYFIVNKLEIDIVRKMFSQVIKDNYKVEINELHKDRSRYKCDFVSFEEALSAASLQRFYTQTKVRKHEYKEVTELLTSLYLPQCDIKYNVCNHGMNGITFFEITSSGLLEPSIDKIRKGFLPEDICIASNGSWYSHAKLEFKYIDNDVWEVYRTYLKDTVELVEKTVEI